METTYTWEEQGEGRTHMTLRNRGEPSGFSKLLAPAMTVAMRRANLKDLERLKSALEAQPSTSLRSRSSASSHRLEIRTR
jgi:hypothetical protein